MSISKRARIQFTSVDRHEVFNVDQSSVGHSSLRTAPKAADIQSDDSFARTQSIILCVRGGLYWVQKRADTFFTRGRCHLIHYSNVMMIYYLSLMLVHYLKSKATTV